MPLERINAPLIYMNDWDSNCGQCCTCWWFVVRRALVQAEINFHVDLHGDWLAVFHSGLKFPVLDRFNGFLIQTQPQSARHANISGMTIRSYNQPQYTSALILRFAGF